MTKYLFDLKMNRWWQGEPVTIVQDTIQIDGDDKENCYLEAMKWFLEKYKDVHPGWLDEAKTVIASGYSQVVVSCVRVGDALR